MTPLLIAAAAAVAAAAGYGLYRWLKKLFSRPQESPTEDNKPKPKPNPLPDHQDKQERDQGPKDHLLEALLRDVREGKIDLDFLNGSNQSAPGGERKLPERYEPIADLWDQVKAIVRAIEFSECKITLKAKIGEEVRQTNIPTGDSEIVTMRDLSQLPKVLTSQMGSEDDIFYPSLATNQLLMQQPIEYEDVFDERTLTRQKSLRVLQDVSGSTKRDRIAWSRLLDTLLAEKAKRARAEFALTTFTDGPKHSTGASHREPESFKKLLDFIEFQIRADGGTNINSTVRIELEKIERENQDLKTDQDARIVLVTDGTQGVDVKYINKQLKELGATLYTVVLGVDHDQLRSISKRYFFIPIRDYS